MRSLKVIQIIFGAVALIGLCLVVAGALEIVHKNSGQRVRATVTGCQVDPDSPHSAGEECTGSWTLGGALVGGHGHLVLGPIDGATPSEVGQKITVHVSGDHAYTSSLVVPIIVIVLGLAMAVFGIFLLIVSERQRRRVAVGAAGGLTTR